MCCYTHTPVVPGSEGEEPFPLAREGVNERCQCPAGNNCPRRATEEDLKCDVCRDPSLWPQDTAARYPGPGIIRPTMDGGLIQWAREPGEAIMREPGVNQEAAMRYMNERYGGVSRYWTDPQSWSLPSDPAVELGLDGRPRLVLPDTPPPQNSPPPEP